jgi:ABC-type glycerol-3-phosphate transport system permease component
MAEREVARVRLATTAARPDVRSVGPRLRSLLRHALLASAVAIVGLPFAWMLSTSLKPLPDVYVFPPIWIPWPLHLENYLRAWEAAPFARYAFNSIVVAGATLAIQAVTVTLAAYAFSHIRMRFREPLFLLVLAVMMIPPQVTFVANFFTLSQLKWIDTYWALIVPFGASGFGTFFLRQSFLAIPVELVDAAKIDGASHLQIVRRIMLPLARPTILTFLLLSFTWRWNDYFWPLIMTNSRDLWTLPVGLVVMRSTEGAIMWHVIMAATLMVIAPVLVLFIATQRYFVQGIARVGIKG